MLNPPLDKNEGLSIPGVGGGTGLGAMVRAEVKIGAGARSGAGARAKAKTKAEAERLPGMQAEGGGETGAGVVQRVTRKGRCKAGGCDLHASFGFPQGSRDFCAGHHVEGMVNLVYQSAKKGAGAARVGRAKGIGGRSARAQGGGKGDAPAFPPAAAVPAVGYPARESW